MLANYSMQGKHHLQICDGVTVSVSINSYFCCDKRSHDGSANFLRNYGAPYGNAGNDACAYKRFPNSSSMGVVGVGRSTYQNNKDEQPHDLYDVWPLAG